MVTRSKKTPPTKLLGVDGDAVLAAYGQWLERQPLAGRSREAYLAQVGGFVNWLAGSEHGAAALCDPAVRDWAVRDYKRHVKTAKRWAPASVNQALAAIDNFYRSLAVGRPDVAREELPQVAPRALDEGDQRRFLRAVEASASARDRAIATVFFYGGLRLSELADLDVGDVEMSARRGRIKIRAGKGDAYREVPLNSACRSALGEWLIERAEQLSGSAGGGGGAGSSALWLSRSGTAMSSRAVDLVMRRFAAAAHLDLSAHVLRHTFVTNLKLGTVALGASLGRVEYRDGIRDKGFGRAA
jgi:site-specific recombinase XerD